jgi:DNA mismatch endonuclease, patch repair protein
LAKVERNQIRDRDTDQRLREAGWIVVRAWEHEAPADVVSRVVEVVTRRRRERGDRPERSAT